MYHFINDARRPYVFSRNRVLFHSKYSNKLQLAIIILFGIWVFTIYYMYKIFSYQEVGHYSMLKRFNLIGKYLAGNITGIKLMLTKKNVY